MEISVTHCASPIGVLQIRGTTEGVTGVTFLDGWDEHRACLRTCKGIPSVLLECTEQLQEYFDGKRKELGTVRVAPRGTEFQRSVWEIILDVPWGASITYREIGTSLGYTHAAQAVGAAVASNPLAVVLPCHRVLPKEGVGGYVWGTWRKQWLLRHEGIVVTTNCQLPTTH